MALFALEHEDRERDQEAAEWARQGLPAPPDYYDE